MQRYMLRAMSSTKMELDLVPWRSPRYSIKTSRRCQRQSASWLRFHNDRGRNTTFCILNFDVIKRRQRTANIVFGTIKANGELETLSPKQKRQQPKHPRPQLSCTSQPDLRSHFPWEAPRAPLPLVLLLEATCVFLHALWCMLLVVLCGPCCSAHIISHSYKPPRLIFLKMTLFTTYTHAHHTVKVSICW
jgi:hypothetical protein